MTGYLSEENHRLLNKMADEQLPPVLHNRVHQTERPFVQVILDMAEPKMYTGRLAIIGDAASLVRPHTASGTAKAYRDAVTLVMDLRAYPDLQMALKNWNRQQLLYANALANHGRQLAARS